MTKISAEERKAIRAYNPGEGNIGESYWVQWSKKLLDALEAAEARAEKAETSITAQYIRVVRSERDALREQVGRLREALEKIANQVIRIKHRHLDGVYDGATAYAHKIATEALSSPVPSDRRGE